MGPEALDEGAHRGHEDARHALRIAQAPHGSQAPAHGVDTRAHALEGQRLPRREHVDLVGPQEGPQIVGHAFCLGRGGDGDHERMAPAQVGQASDGDRTRRLGDGDHGRRGPSQGGERRLGAQKRRKRPKLHVFTLPIAHL